MTIIATAKQRYSLATMERLAILGHLLYGYRTNRCISLEDPEVE